MGVKDRKHTPNFYLDDAVFPFKESA